MSQMAAVLGNSTAAARYAEYANKGTAAFHSYFFNATVGRYGGDIGAIQSLSLPALKIGSPPASLYPAVVKTVGDDIKNINYTMAVGAVTSKILFNMLSENGMHEARPNASRSLWRPLLTPSVLMRCDSIAALRGVKSSPRHMAGGKGP